MISTRSDLQFSGESLQSLQPVFANQLDPYLFGQIAEKDANLSSVIDSPHWKNWKKVKGSSVSNETSPYVPGTILMFESFAEEVLDPANTNARQMLEDNKEFLKEISFSDGSAEQSTFGDLFETEEYEAGDSESDMQEDIMRADFDGE